MVICFKTATQVAFKVSVPKDYDIIPGKWVGGIAYGNNILCGETGEVFDLADFTAKEISVRAMPWVPISDEIIGDLTEDEIEEDYPVLETEDAQQQLDELAVNNLSKMQLEMAHDKRERQLIAEEFRERLNENNKEYSDEDIIAMVDIFIAGHDDGIPDSEIVNNIIENYFI